MECDPKLKVFVEKVAIPLLLRTPMPKVVVLSLKVTFALGVWGNPGHVLTVAVKVTVWPKVAGLISTLRAVAVNFTSALYVASSTPQLSLAARLA